METLTDEETHQYLLNQNGRIIHQIWFFEGILPKHKSKKMFKSQEKYRNAWINHNPTWYYKLWTYEECRKLIKVYFPEHFRMFESYPFQIQRCDCVRYFILYLYGGLYVDSDYVSIQPWDEVIKKYQQDLYLVETPNKLDDTESHVSNSLMFSKRPNHPYWKAVFIELEKNCGSPVYYGKHLSVMYTTGPCIINRVFQKYKRTFKLNIYPKELFQPYGIENDYMSKLDKDKIYCYHLSTESWVGSDSGVLNFAYLHMKLILFILGIMIVNLIL